MANPGISWKRFYPNLAPCTQKLKLEDSTFLGRDIFFLFFVFPFQTIRTTVQICEHVVESDLALPSPDGVLRCPDQAEPGHPLTPPPPVVPPPPEEIRLPPPRNGRLLAPSRRQRRAAVALGRKEAVVPPRINYFTF